MLDSLRHWVTEYHVDGFRFDLASALTRAADGTPLADPPLIREMTADATLKQAKLIAEPWDCGGLYQVTPLSRMHTPTISALWGAARLGC